MCHLHLAGWYIASKKVAVTSLLQFILKIYQPYFACWFLTSEDVSRSFLAVVYSLHQPHLPFSFFLSRDLLDKF